MRTRLSWLDFKLGFRMLVRYPGPTVVASPGPGGLALVLLHSVVMLAICLLACLVPTRRALGIEPAEALKHA